MRCPFQTSAASMTRHEYSVRVLTTNSHSGCAALVAVVKSANLRGASIPVAACLRQNFLDSDGFHKTHLSVVKNLRQSPNQ